ncbi:MAG: hypothetical protein QOI08_3791 [Actinomycetota bacterium]|nr:hypothetical protein [Actinomycetota bacterium]
MACRPPRNRHQASRDLRLRASGPATRPAPPCPRRDLLAAAGGRGYQVEDADLAGGANGECLPGDA